MIRNLMLLLLGGLAMFSMFNSSAGQISVEEADVVKGFPSPVMELKSEKGQKSARLVLAGGCFWCTEDLFDAINGVTDVVSGYAGGSAADADYQRVSSGGTDHAEVIEITYNPEKITYAQLLKIFFSVAHDPTQLNRQGPDTGKQYRSAIFFANEDQKAFAEAYIKQLNSSGFFKKPIVTTVEKLEKFYPAEQYHQDFVDKNPNNPYVVVNSRPKLQKLKKAYPSLVEGKKD